MKKARKKFELKDIKNTGSRTKSSGLFHRYFYVTVLILFISFAILGSGFVILTGYCNFFSYAHID